MNEYVSRKVSKRLKALDPNADFI